MLLKSCAEGKSRYAMENQALLVGIRVAQLLLRSGPHAPSSVNRMNSPEVFGLQPEVWVMDPEASEKLLSLGTLLALCG
jgi:hypothetical protein